MAILAGDIKFYYSGSGTTANPELSIGGAISANEVGGTLEQLFDTVTGAESTAGMSDYRGIYVRNEHASLALSSIAMFIQTNDTDSEISIAKGDEAINTSLETTTENVAPTGPSFTAPSTYGTGIAIPDLTGNGAAGDYQGIWIRRTVAPGNSAESGSTATLRVQGDTPA